MKDYKIIAKFNYNNSRYSVIFDDAEIFLRYYKTFISNIYRMCHAHIIYDTYQIIAITEDVELKSKTVKYEEL